MHALSLVRASHQLPGVRRATGGVLLEVTRELGRAAAALAAVLAWGILLLVLAA